MTTYLTLEDLLTLCSDLGGLSVRDIGLLEAAVRRPATSLFGREAYPSVHDKAAVLLESITRNHALIDGNKRLGWLAIHIFYGLNGLALDAPDDDAYALVIAVSTGEAGYADAARVLAGWTSESSNAG